MPARSAIQLSGLFEQLRPHFEAGRPYATWNSGERFEYVRTFFDLVRTLPRVRVPDAPEWQDVLAWWLWPDNDRYSKPEPKNVWKWHKFSSTTFGYYTNWVLGGMIALATEEANPGQLSEWSLGDWPKTGLPWIVFWLKELMLWGALEPVASDLLARGVTATRAAAQRQAQSYYRQWAGLSANDLLNPSAVRNWVDELREQQPMSEVVFGPGDIKVELLRHLNNSVSHPCAPSRHR